MVWVRRISLGVPVITSDVRRTRRNTPRAGGRPVFLRVRSRTTLFTQDRKETMNPGGVSMAPAERIVSRESFERGEKERERGRKGVGLTPMF